MASSPARASRRTPPARRSGPRPLAVALTSGSVRWDRVGRVALLVVLLGVLLLYVGPAHSYLQTWKESKARRAQVQRLQAENVRLRTRRRSLENPHALERAARRLGMVRPGERAFVVRGLPDR
jgi:cell division protein FtsB